MTTIKGYLIECEGRSLFMRDKEDVLWAMEDDNYEVTALVAQPKTDVYDRFIAYDTQERIQLMDELFTLQDKEITLLKQRLEAFVEVVEGIAELTQVVSQSAIENRSKLLIISDSCKKILAPQE